MLGGAGSLSRHMRRRGPTFVCSCRTQSPGRHEAAVRTLVSVTFGERKRLQLRTRAPGAAGELPSEASVCASAPASSSGHVVRQVPQSAGPGDKRTATRKQSAFSGELRSEAGGQPFKVAEKSPQRAMLFS